MRKKRQGEAAAAPHLDAVTALLKEDDYWGVKTAAANATENVAPSGPQPFKHNGVDYLKHEEGLYDPTTGDLVGVWDAETSTVGPVPDDDSDEESEE